MQRLFISPDQIDGESARITGADHLHLARVLRMRPGEPLLLLNGLGAAFTAELVEVGKTSSLARILAKAPPPPHPRLHVTVAQALGKGDKFEQVVQHGTEAGALEFLPIRADRCVSELRDDRLSDRLARWQSIAKGAAEQSGRATIPRVRGPETVEHAVSGASGLQIFLHTGTPARPLYAALQEAPLAPSSATVFVGPEGGWTARELQCAISAGCTIVSLGPYILRAETAALVAISQLLYHYSGTWEITQCES